MYVDGLDLLDKLTYELESAMGTQELLYELLSAMHVDNAIDLLAFVERIHGFERDSITRVYLEQHKLKG